MESGASRGQLGQPRPAYPDLRGAPGGCPTCPPLAWKSGAPPPRAHRATASTAPDSHTPHRPDADEFSTGFPRAPECLTKATGKPLPQSTNQPINHPPRRPRSKPPLAGRPRHGDDLEGSHALAGRPNPTPWKQARPNPVGILPASSEPPSGALSPVAHESSTPRRAARVEMARGATRRRPRRPHLHLAHAMEAPSMASTPSRRARAPWHTPVGAGRSAIPSRRRLAKRLVPIRGRGERGAQ